MTNCSLIEDLIESVIKYDTATKDVRVGLSWAGVHGDRCGIATVYEPRNSAGNYTNRMGSLTDNSTLELACLARSWNLVEAGIGVAAINSMVPLSENCENNAVDIILDMAKDKNIVMVGAFPFSEKIRRIAKQLWVLELDQELIDPDGGVIPSSASEYVIPESDIVVITGSAVVNKSIERLLALSSEANAYTIVMGPSTPMSNVLFDYGADLIAGVRVLKPEAIMRKLSQSGGILTPMNCPGELAYITINK